MTRRSNKLENGFSQQTNDVVRIYRDKRLASRFAMSASSRGSLMQRRIGEIRSFSSDTTKKQGGFLKPIHATGLGAIVLTLATQNLAQELAGGFAIHAQSDVAVGDEVKLGDGTGGIVHSIGWISCSIRGYVRTTCLVADVTLQSLTSYNRLLTVVLVLTVGTMISLCESQTRNYFINE